MALTLSADGKTFNRSYLLRSGESSDYPDRRYEGKAKTLGYSYPKALVYDGNLYVSYSTNKDDAQYTRVPINNITTGIETARATDGATFTLAGRTLMVSAPAGSGTVDVCDLSGTVYLHATSHEAHARFSLDGCPSGVCLIRVRTSQGVITRKVFLQ